MISIVTVNYKTADYVERMLDSLFAHVGACGIEVFVVENGSGDDMEPISRRFPNVTVIESEENLGFAGGCNLAIERATGDYVLLVNPDIVFTQDAVCAIRERMDAHPQVGVGGISLKNMDGSQQLCVRRFPKPLDQFFLLMKAHHLFPNLRAMKRWRRADFDYGTSQQVDQVMGAFFCIRREALEEIGPLDDGYFIWYEEVDFCKRAKDAGWQVHYFADISAKHKKGSSFERVHTYTKQAILRASVRRYMRKHHGVAVWLVFVAFEPIFLLTSLIASVLKPK